MATELTYDALVLSGGRARRLGGVSKPELELAGVPLIVTALAAASGAVRTIVVGPPTSHHPAPLTVREDPAGGGPVAAIAAGVGALGDGEEWMLVLACDSPHAANAVPSLAAAASASNRGAVIGVDRGRRQPLLAMYRRSALEEALAAGALEGSSMQSLLERLEIDEVVLPAGSARDVDTWEDANELGKDLT